MASAITSSSGDWKFDIGDARIMGGSISAQLQSTRANESNALFFKLSAMDVNAAELESVLGTGHTSLSGVMNMNADLRTSVPMASPGLLSVNGELEFEVNEGELFGFDLASLMASIGDDTVRSYQSPSQDASTPFQKLDVKLFLNNSNATLSKAHLSLSPEQNIQILGNADFHSGALAMRAQETTENGPKPERLVIGGTLKSPFISLTVDPNAKPKDDSTGSEKQPENNG